MTWKELARRLNNLRADELEQDAVIQDPINADECIRIGSMTDVSEDHPLNGVLDEGHMILVPTNCHF